MLSRNNKQYVSLNRKPSIFAGFLFCDECGKPMVRSQAHGKSDYLCSSYKKYSSKICNSHLIYEDELTNLVTTEISSFIKNQFKDMSLDIRNKGMNIKIVKIEKDIFQLHKKIEDSENALKSTYVDYKSDVLNEEDFLHAKEYLKQQIKEHDKDILLLEEEKNKILYEAKNYNKHIKNVIKGIDKKGLRREIIVFLVDKIEVSNEKTINITYKSIF